MRCNPRPAINEGADRRCKLDRRDLKGLPERNRRKLHRTDLILCVHDCTGFSRHIDSSSVQQPELLHALVKRICTHPKPYRHKHWIAGIHRPLYEIFSSMTPNLCTPDFSALYDNIARALKRILFPDNAVFQCCRRNDLKGRARLVGIVDAGVSPHFIQGFLLFFFGHELFLLPLRKCERVIQLIFRHIRHRKDFSVIGTQHQNRNAFRFFFQADLLRQLLCVQLDVGIQTNV